MSPSPPPDAGPTTARRRRASVIAFRGDETLAMLRRKRGRSYATLVGGRIEAGEDAGAAALRELREKTGLEGTILCALPDVVPGEQLAHLVSCDGEPELGGPEAERQNPRNRYEPAWVPLDALATLGLRPAAALDAVRAALALR